MESSRYIRAAAAALLGGAILCSTASAAPPDQGGFSAMQGVKAQTLSVEEMQAISGELNAYDISAALFDTAAKLDRYPKLQAATSRLAEYYKTNAVSINEAFKKLGIFTPCQTC